MPPTFKKKLRGFVLIYNIYTSIGLFIHINPKVSQVKEWRSHGFYQLTEMQKQKNNCLSDGKICHSILICLVAKEK